MPFAAPGPAFNDLIPGRVDVMFNNHGAVLPLIAGNKLRGLAVTSAPSARPGAEFPPIAPKRRPGFDVTSWYGFFAPAKTPADIRAQENPTRSRRSATRHKSGLIARVAAIASTPAEPGRFSSGK